MRDGQEQTGTSLGLVALLVFFVMYGAGWATGSSPDESQPPPTVAGPGYTEELPALGPADAPVVIVFVADLKCVFCAKHNAFTKRVVAQYATEARIVFKHFPFISRPSSEDGAIATMAANRQGHFWAYLDQLFLHQSESWTREHLTEYAEAIGLDTQQFVQDLQDPALLSYVRLDKAAAEALQIRATPTVYINGRKFENFETMNEFRIAVREARDKVLGIVERGEAPTIEVARALSAANEYFDTTGNYVLGEYFASYYMNNDVTSLDVSLARSLETVR